MDLSMRSDVTVGRNVRLDANQVEVGRGVVIGDDVVIEAHRIVLGDGVRIDDGVVIRTHTLELGHGCRIETRARLSGMTGSAKFIRIGEQTLIAHDSKVLVPIAVIGDYTAIHNHVLLNGGQPIVIGHACWIGQNCLLNAEAALTIGNFVGIGAYSSVYTHGYFGDLLEGCNVFKVAPVELKDDAWILGSYNIISPGVTVGRKALVLTGSNVTKDVPDNHTVGGAPAKDMTDRLVPYREVPAAEKLLTIRAYVVEYLEKMFPGRYTISDQGFDVDAPSASFAIRFCDALATGDALPQTRPLLVFTMSNVIVPALPGVTVFDVSNRSYTRTRSEAEVGIITFLKSYRARFVPTDHPRVEVPEQFRSA